MPALNFKTKFVPLILDETKQQTIRAVRKDNRPHCKVGDTLKLYAGMRTKDCTLIKEVTVIENSPIKICEDSITLPHIELWWKMSSCNCHDTQDSLMMDSFAKADGFENWIEMRDWFEETHGLPFTGTLIKWRK